MVICTDLAFLSKKMEGETWGCKSPYVNCYHIVAIYRL